MGSSSLPVGQDLSLSRLGAAKDPAYGSRVRSQGKATVDNGYFGAVL
jgi:hypothetical protein